MKLACFLLLLLWLWMPLRAFSQSSGGATASLSAQATATATTEYTLPPPELEKSKALYVLRGTMQIAGFAYSLVVLITILLSGIVARYRTWAEAVSGNRFVQASIVVPLFFITTDLSD